MFVLWYVTKYSSLMLLFLSKIIGEGSMEEYLRHLEGSGKGTVPGSNHVGSNSNFQSYDLD